MAESADVRLARLEERLKAAENALRLQATEYDRRLTDLNGAHEKAVDVQNTYVTEEKFTAFVQRYEENRASIAEALTLAAGAEEGIGRLWGWVAGGAGFLLVVLSIVLLVGDVLTP